jgi:hypothetical protein
MAFFFYWGNFTRPPRTTSRFEIPPINFKNSQFTPMNFQLLSIWTHPYKLGYKIFEKDQNTYDFNFLKKLKNILEIEILNSDFCIKFQLPDIFLIFFKKIKIRGILDFFKNFMP